MEVGGQPRPGRFTAGKETSCPLCRRLGGLQGLCGLVREMNSTGIRSLDRPARSEWLYRLRCHGKRELRFTETCIYWKQEFRSGENGAKMAFICRHTGRIWSVISKYKESVCRRGFSFYCFNSDNFVPCSNRRRSLHVVTTSTLLICNKTERLLYLQRMCRVFSWSVVKGIRASWCRVAIG
jgi:hypothetical protein